MVPGDESSDDSDSEDDFSSDESSDEDDVSARLGVPLPSDRLASLLDQLLTLSPRWCRCAREGDLSFCCTSRETRRSGGGATRARARVPRVWRGRAPGAAANLPDYR